MTATNHALTGAVIGLAIANPLLAIPLALLSHYVLDALPHYHPDTPDERLMRSKGFMIYLAVEALLCFLIVLLLVISRPDGWLLAVFCAFVAAAPDLLSIPTFQRVRHGKPQKLNAYTRFAKNIQWFERPSGAIVEIVWFLSISIALISYLT